MRKRIPTFLIEKFLDVLPKMKIKGKYRECNICNAYMYVFHPKEVCPCSTCDTKWRRFLRRFTKNITKYVI